jgi:hypothetical protein
MNITKPRNIARTSLRQRPNKRITYRRSRSGENPEYPAFLIRLVGEVRAKGLCNEVIIHHRHD